MNDSPQLQTLSGRNAVGNSLAQLISPTQLALAGRKELEREGSTTLKRNIPRSNIFVLGVRFLRSLSTLILWSIESLTFFASSSAVRRTARASSDSSGGNGGGQTGFVAAILAALGMKDEAYGGRSTDVSGVKRIYLESSCLI